MEKPIIVENAPIKLVRLSKGSTGTCPCCNERPGYAYQIPGIRDGYVEACKVCAPDEIEFTIQDLAS